MHTKRNGNLKPEDIKVMSNRKLWWQCPEGHEWKARVSDRVRGTKCPYCEKEGGTNVL